MHGHGETVHVPFPFDDEDLKAGKVLVGYKYSGLRFIRFTVDVLSLVVLTSLICVASPRVLVFQYVCAQSP